MNSNTKAAFFRFIDQVEILAQGVIHQTGTQSCVELLAQAEELKNALNKDETIAP